MSVDDGRTYTQDDVSRFVNEFTDPHVDIELKHFPTDTKHYVVIQISEFEEVSVICEKGSSETIRGRIYCRTHRQVESSSRTHYFVSSFFEQKSLKKKIRIK